MKKRNKKIALYAAITALLTSTTTAAIIYVTLKKAYKNLSFEFEDWLD